MPKLLLIIYPYHTTLVPILLLFSVFKRVTILIVDLYELIPKSQVQEFHSIYVVIIFYSQNYYCPSICLIFVFRFHNFYSYFKPFKDLLPLF
jgi:hypothetical protein